MIELDLFSDISRYVAMATNFVSLFVNVWYDTAKKLVYLVKHLRI